jgi:hypothetical protein
VAAMISASGAPLARFICAMTLVFLLARVRFEFGGRFLGPVGPLRGLCFFGGRALCLRLRASGSRKFQSGRHLKLHVQLFVRLHVDLLGCSSQDPSHLGIPVGNVFLRTESD